MENKKNMLKRLDFTQQPFLPIFNEVVQKQDWVYYGEDNLMPIYLISRYNNSAIHKAIVTAKQHQIVGDGLVSLNNPMATVNLINNKENVYDVFKKCALDYVLFGGFALNVIWSRDRSQIAEIYHMDFSKIRSGKINEDDEVTHYYYSYDWGNIRKYIPEVFPAFAQDAENPSQIYYFKDYSPNLTYYPHPDYSGGLASIEIDVNIKEFHARNLQNNMLPSLWIDFVNGVPGEEEQRLITRALEEQYSSVNNAGRPIISFSESSELAPRVTQIPASANDGYYQAIYEDIIRSIASAHRVSSLELFGIATAGKLGAANEIVEHTEYFRKTVIMPYQNAMLPVFNKLISMKFQQPTIFEIKPLSIFEVSDVIEKPVVEDKPVTPVQE